MTHVLLVTGEYPPMQGGVGAYTAKLGQALIGLGVTVSVITSNLATSEENANPYPHVYPHVQKWGLATILAVARLARNQAVDWVHVQYQTAAYGMNPAINLAPYLWRRWGLATGWTYHDLLVPYLFPKAGKAVRRWVTERPAFGVDFTVVTNEGDRRQLAGRVHPLVKIPIGSNVSGSILSASQRRERRKARGYGEDDLVLAYFGFLNRSKGGIIRSETLHQLVAQGRHAHLLMIGERIGASDPSNIAYLAEIETCIVELGLEERVSWTGHQSDSAVSTDLNAVDVLLMPYEDGVSLRRGTLMAGLVNGCAIVTTEPQIPLPELVNGRDLLMVPPEDPVACADAVVRIVDNPGLATHLRRHARQRSRAFSWPSIAEEHLHLYIRP